MNEWRNIPGLNGLYQVNIDVPEGRCRRLSKNGNIRELNNKPDKNNRLSWRLCGRTQQAARWIALTYPELVQNEYFEGAQIDHIDTNSMNNHPSNLRWVTSSGNKRNPLTIEHYRQVALKRVMSEETKEKIKQSKLGKKLSIETKEKMSLYKNKYPESCGARAVLQYNTDGIFIKRYVSVSMAARENCISQGNISMCCIGKRKTTGGFIWKYA